MLDGTFSWEDVPTTPSGKAGDKQGPPAPLFPDVSIQDHAGGMGQLRPLARGGAASTVIRVTECSLPPSPAEGGPPGESLLDTRMLARSRHQLSTPAGCWLEAEVGGMGGAGSFAELETCPLEFEVRGDTGSGDCHRSLCLERKMGPGLRGPGIRTSHAGIPGA